MRNIETLGTTVSLPASYDEVTVQQFLKIREHIKEQDLCRILAALTPVLYEEWYNADIVDDNMAEILDVLDWLKTPVDLSKLPVPKTVTLGDKKLVVPKDLNLKSFGQRVVFEQQIFEAVKKSGDITDVIVEAIAIYLQPLYTGAKFDTDTLEEVYELCKTLPITQAYPLASFFLTQYSKLTKRKDPSSSKGIRSAKRKPVLKSSKSWVS